MNTHQRSIFAAAAVVAVVGLSLGTAGAALAQSGSNASAPHPTQAVSAKSTAAMLNPQLKPVINDSAPLEYGMLASTSVGRWAPNSSALTYTYQWYENGKAVSGATHSNHTVGVAAATSGNMTVAVTAHLAGFAPSTQMSDPVATRKKAMGTEIKGGFDVVVPSHLKVGTELKSAATTWYVTAPKITYQWLRNGAQISGAVHSTYKLTAADSGAMLALTAVASKSGYVDDMLISQGITVPTF